MLKRVLQVIIKGEMMNAAEIARAIGVRPETLEDMIKLLLNRGFLRTENCASAEMTLCAACPSHAACASGVHSGRAYYVTEKGRRYAES
ncbi:MAG: hypothetical protein EAX95_07680 [Candidatus Thorarchaeota archaeon]|nr:hypothetical protein [Candidatus Thorarchaeota archaeon]